MRLALTLRDVAEMLSSLALADMDFARRMLLAPGGSLPQGQRIAEALPNSPDRRALAAAATRLFGLGEDVTLPLGENACLECWAEILLHAWAAPPVRYLTFSTSGSTGIPVAITHDVSLLSQEVRTLARVLAGARRVVAHVPRHHIYGFLFAVMLPKALRIPCCWRNPMPMLGLAVSFEPGDLVIAHPMFWRTLAEGGLHFRENVRGTTSSGPCPAEVAHALRRLGIERLTEVYGSSETSGMGIRHESEAPYELMSHWSRLSDGRVSRRHPVTMRRLAYSPQDELGWEEERFFRPAGRKDKAVQVAGVNVFPQRVRQVLLECPGVLDCAVRLMRPDEGTRLKAAIVVEDTESCPGAWEQRLRLWLHSRLTRYEMPGSLRVIEKLPMNAMGKPQDWD